MKWKRFGTVVLILAAGAGGQAAGPPERQRFEQQVAALVRQLGDDDFERREAAQRALLRLGPDILPVVEKLGPQEDEEVRQRLHRIHRRLVGLFDDLRAALAALPEPGPDARPAIPEGLQRLILQSQPRAGDYLLRLLADPREPLRRRADNTFVHALAGMSAAQIHKYLHCRLALEAQHRLRYPQGIDAGIQMGYHCHPGWPPEAKLALTTWTRHFIDGKPYGKPYRYQGAGACTGWLRTGDLSLGRHSCALEMEYEFTHRGAKHRGRLHSRDFYFTIVSAGAPDDLAAPADPALVRLVRKALRFAKQGSDSGDESEELWETCESVWRVRQPHINWAEAVGQPGDPAAVAWKVAEPLPVDLCFEASLQDLKTGKVYRCDPLVLSKGATGSGYFRPRDAAAFARGKPGDAGVQVVLTPSRKMALTLPQVKRYYARSIRSPVFKPRVTGGGW
jgi:hypothetical protein